MEKKQYKTIYVTQEITVPNGFSGTQSNKLQLDQSYDFCDGVLMVERSNANADQFDISISDRNNTYIDAIPKQLYDSGNAVSPDDRYKSVFMPITDGILTDPKIIADVATTAEIKLTVVFRLRREIPVPKAKPKENE